MEHTLPSGLSGIFDHCADAGAGVGLQQQPDRTSALLCSVQPGGFRQQSGHRQPPCAGYISVCSVSAPDCGGDPAAS